VRRVWYTRLLLLQKRKEEQKIISVQERCKKVRGHVFEKKVKGKRKCFCMKKNFVE
jgi:hypothetical protein